MSQIIVSSSYPILLVGGGDCDKTAFDAGLALCRTVVAADGGADRVLGFGRVPDAVIGDLDSVSDSARQRIAPDRLHHIPEQDSTDFDKALRSVAAPLVIGVGFLGGRMDHALAALTVLARRPDRRCVLIGPEDTVLIVPPSLDLDLSPGTRVSLWPMARVTGRSTGLHWPIDGLSFTPDRLTGTSNHADGPVSLRMDSPGMVALLPRAVTPAVLDGLSRCPDGWPAHDTE